MLLYKLAHILSRVVMLAVICSPTSAARNLIRNGSFAQPGKYPSFVQVHVHGFGLICGGTLVAKDVVLTAAHCRNLVYTNIPLFLLFVRTTTIDGGHEDHPILASTTHPKFDGKHPEKGNDLMLLKFKNAMEENSTTLVQLNSDSEIPHVGSIVSLAGMGLTSPRWTSRSETLLEAADLKVVGCPPILKGGNLLCTSIGPSHANPCTFDSGSPLFFSGNIQVGITSLDDDTSGSQPTCGTNHTGFTAISRYFDWIEREVKDFHLHDESERLEVETKS